MTEMYDKKKKAKLEETSWMDQQTREIQECIEKKNYQNRWLL